MITETNAQVEEQVTEQAPVQETAPQESTPVRLNSRERRIVTAMRQNQRLDRQPRELKLKFSRVMIPVSVGVNHAIIQKSLLNSRFVNVDHSFSWVYFTLYRSASRGMKNEMDAMVDDIITQLMRGVEDQISFMENILQENASCQLQFTNTKTVTINIETAWTRRFVEAMLRIDRLLSLSEYLGLMEPVVNGEALFTKQMAIDLSFEFNNRIRLAMVRCIHLPRKFASKVSEVRRERQVSLSKKLSQINQSRQNNRQAAETNAPANQSIDAGEVKKDSQDTSTVDASTSAENSAA